MTAAQRLQDAVLDRFMAGETIWALAWDYDRSGGEIEDLIRAALQSRRWTWRRQRERERGDE